MDGESPNTGMTRAEYLVSLAVQAGSNGGCDAAAVFTRFRAIVSMLADSASASGASCRIVMHLSMSLL